ncbi:endonuclease/exonuclease/phosphatase family protein [Hyalangium rubrum]|uniref:Endonuclease/exonuclease/phosphatase family protein n=1 Tax=Hyalangium rubrum TaxID=3103134 RepID=A0ABU5H4Q7_9BACT|nr:endonuclease/exonuclease/phosphatase family protein [Hyalangium sp. s54d21]MDY7228097.1 endonuclease/exonuclease/phosphatase family protein [Hyalangium sp. s54d21]
MRLSFHRRFAPLLTCAALALAGCSDDRLQDPPVEAKVMTRNIYLGGNIFLLAQAQSPQQVPVVAAQLFATVQATDFAARAERLAEEIQATDPALIGLQEVSRYRTQHPSDYVSSNRAVNAQDTAVDFLAILLEELKERGLDYRIAAMVQNADAELPAALSGNANDLTDIRLTDYDVILARGDVATTEEVEQNYTFNAQVSVGGGAVTFTRGFTKVAATLDGAKFTFVNSHLEGLMPANPEQANELVGILQGYAEPLILVGDLNTGPGSSTPAYGIFTDTAGLEDAWPEVGTGPGFTCCFSEKVNDTQTTGLDERIDLVLYRGQGIRPTAAEVVGDELANRTASGLWPSDHAGAVVTFSITR